MISMARAALAGDRPIVAGIGISHPDRVLFPAAGITKLDLARYYDAIAEWMLPDLVDRPLTLVHCPKGVPPGGARKGVDCVFMKHARVWGPSAIRRVRIREKTKVGEYLIVDSVAALVGLAQMDVLEIHTWNSRFARLEQPDRIVVDLDPGEQVTWGTGRRGGAARQGAAARPEARELRENDRRPGPARRRAAGSSRGLERVPRLRTRVRAVARAAQAEAVHGAVREDRPRRQDSDRLPAKQPDQHLHRRLLDARQAGGDRLRAAHVDRTVAVGAAAAVHDRDRPQSRAEAACRSVEPVLENAAAASTRGNRRARADLKGIRG